MVSDSGDGDLCAAHGVTPWLCTPSMILVVRYVVFYRLLVEIR